MIKETTKQFKVLIGQVILTRPPNILQTVLGSCLGVVLYDEVNNIMGMTHILLPCSEGRPKSDLPGKYADDALPCLYNAIIKKGGKHENIKAKIAGGARMFQTSVDYSNNDVGSANICAVKKQLSILSIPIKGEDTGGNTGRKMELDPQSFMVSIEKFSQGACKI